MTSTDTTAADGEDSTENTTVESTRGHGRGPWLRRLVAALVVLVVVAVATPFVIHAAPGVVGGEASYVVLSGSMAPVMTVGDVIVIERVDTATLAVGDIVSFDRPGERQPVTHRIVAVETDHIGTYYRTKGDASEAVDATSVRPNAVIGRLMEPKLPILGAWPVVFPGLGNVIRFTDTPVGFALVVVVPVAGLLLVEIRQLIQSANARTTQPQPDAAPSRPETPSVPTDDGDAAVADGGWAAATPAVVGTAADTATDGTVSFTKRDLTATSLALGSFALYSGAIAYITRISWTVAVFVLAVGGFLFAVGVRVAAPPAPGGVSGPDPGRVVTAELPAALRSAPRTTVQSLSHLLETAAAADRRVVADADGEGYFLPDGDVVLYVPPDGEVTAEAQTDDEQTSEDQSGRSDRHADGGDSARARADTDDDTGVEAAGDQKARSADQQSGDQ
jgi:signal peptidase